MVQKLQPFLGLVLGVFGTFQVAQRVLSQSSHDPYRGSLERFYCPLQRLGVRSVRIFVVQKLGAFLFFKGLGVFPGGQGVIYQKVHGTCYGFREALRCAEHATICRIVNFDLVQKLQVSKDMVILCGLKAAALQCSAIEK